MSFMCYVRAVYIMYAFIEWSSFRLCALVISYQVVSGSRFTTPLLVMVREFGKLVELSLSKELFAIIALHRFQNNNRVLIATKTVT